MYRFLHFSDEVRKGLQDAAPIVALESTIIAHGMPYPQNLEVAREVEALIRDNGAIPATIAIVRGQIRVGLSDDELKMIASDRTVLKASRRDITVLQVKGLTGATTVAATMAIAENSGIRVFVTGGIGGVHRGVVDTMDVSADLTELGRANVAVVCSGAKSILDLPRTLEVLETLGVPVLGYQTMDFPAFFCRESGLSVDHRVDSPKEIAAIMRAKWDLGLQGGLVIANPVPQSESMESSLVEKLTEEALETAEERGIRGKNVTPFLLDYLQKRTQGETLRANIALVKNNALLGAEIAKAYSRYL